MSRPTRPGFQRDAGSAEVLAGITKPGLIHVAPAQVRVAPEFNPRRATTEEDRAFSDASLRSLGESLQRDGVLSPILIRQDEQGGYVLIAGERRLRAALLVGLPTIPALLRDAGGAARLALVENLQREQLNAVDETFAVLALLAQDTGLTPGSLPAALRAAARPGSPDPHDLAGKLRSYGRHSLDAWARHRLQLLRMTDAELDAVRRGTPWRVVAELTRLPEGAARAALLEDVLSHQLAARAVRERVQALLGVETRQSADWTPLVRGVRPDRLAALPENQQARARALLEELQRLLPPG
jgi:ParB family chromosome partitioning protein